MRCFQKVAKTVYHCKKCLHSHFACHNHVYNLNIPYFGHDCRQFINKLQSIINSKLQLTLKINPVYKTLQVSQYFLLKTHVPPALYLNIIHQFSCSCDFSLTYIGMPTRHLSIRMSEHLSFYLKTEGSIKNHIMSCNICANSKFNINLFEIIKKCNSNFETKIHEALLIKKHNRGLKRQLFANGSSFLLNILNCYLAFTWCIDFTIVALLLHF